MSVDARPVPGGLAASHLRWYLLSHGGWFASLGLQFVLFPYLVANVLGMAPSMVGLAMMCLMAPSLLFLLFGGAVAEQSDCRRIVVLIHLIAAVPPVTLAVVLSNGGLSYGVLIAYALVMGTCNAFVLPARDSLLTRVAGGDIQRAVTLTMIVQLSAQLAGLIVAGAAAFTGVVPLLAAQAAIMLFGAFAGSRLPAAPPVTEPTPLSRRFSEVREGVVEVARSPYLAPVVACMFAVGLFYVGSFMTVLPLFVRDVYGGGPAELSLVNVGFWGGTILATMTLLRIGGVARRGLVMLIALGTGTCILAAMSFPAPFAVLVGLTLLWGLGAGTTMTLSRTIVQERAPESHRARVLSIYQLGFAGGGPVGAFATGILVGAFGPHDAVLVPAGIALLVFGALGLTTQLARIGPVEVPDIAIAKNKFQD